jgi:hypothetical protein
MNQDEEVTLEVREKLAKEVEEYVTFYRGKLETPYQNMVRYHKVFLNEVKDRRKRDEQWRAFVPTPYGWSTIKSMSAAYNDMILGQTPVIKPHAISSKNRLAANNIQRLFDFIFRRISFPANLKRSTEISGIQGVSVAKNVLVEKSITTFIHPDEKKEQAFTEALARANEANMEIPDMNDRENFEAWRLQANELSGLGIPEAPTPGPHRMRKYFGPSFQNTSIFDLVFDPDIQDPMEFPVIVQRSIKPLSWLMDRTGLDESKIFDPVAVASGRKGIPDEQVSKWQREIQAAYGLNSDQISNPRMKNAVEIWEAWCPGLKNNTYRVILNRQTVINKNMDNPYPFKHPYIWMRNNTVSGNALGISEFKVVERLFYEMNTLRSLRLDALMLNVIPMFVKARDGKLSQKESFIRPGKVFSSSNPQAFRQIVQMGLDPSMFKEDSEIKNDINEATGTLPVLRGATAAPRVPTGNVEAAAQQAFTRVKDRILEFEGELNPFITNSLAMMYQFWPDEMMVRVGGDPRMNPFVTYSTDNFLEAVEADYAFQGARTAFDQDALIQQSKEWFTILAGVAELIPTYKMDAHARVISEMILKDGAQEVFMSDEEVAQLEEQQAQEEAAASTEDGEEEQEPQQEGVEPPPEG